MAKEPAKPQFALEHICKELNIQPRSARAALRRHKVPKTDGIAYSWKNRKEFDAVVKQLKGDEAKPAKKPSKKAPAKKVAKKKATAEAAA